MKQFGRLCLYKGVYIAVALISVQQHYRNYLRGKLNLVSNQLADKLLVKTNNVMDLFVGTINKKSAC